MSTKGLLCVLFAIFAAASGSALPPEEEAAEQFLSSDIAKTLQDQLLGKILDDIKQNGDNSMSASNDNNDNNDDQDDETDLEKTVRATIESTRSYLTGTVSTQYQNAQQHVSVGDLADFTVTIQNVDTDGLDSFTISHLKQEDDNTLNIRFNFDQIQAAVKYSIDGTFNGKDIQADDVFTMVSRTAAIDSKIVVEKDDNDNLMLDALSVNHFIVPSKIDSGSLIGNSSPAVNNALLILARHALNNGNEQVSAIMSEASKNIINEVLKRQNN